MRTFGVRVLNFGPNLVSIDLSHLDLVELWNLPSDCLSPVNFAHGKLQNSHLDVFPMHRDRNFFKLSQISLIADDVLEHNYFLLGVREVDTRLETEMEV